MIKKFAATLVLLAFAATTSIAAETVAKKKILFFSKSSGFEHPVISWKKGQPSWAEKTLTELGDKNGWEFTFSKDGSKFSKDYLAQFETVFFYTTGDLCTPGTDGQPAMTAEGKQALFDYVRGGKGFVGTHSASDTFHTDGEATKGQERYLNHGDKADSYVRFLGAEFIIHGSQQAAKNTVIDPKFPGFENVGADFNFTEEWYSLKDFNSDIHVLTVIDAPAMHDAPYKRPAYPTTWARAEGNGRVFFTAMGHREDIWTNPTFQQILVGGIKWALGELKADVTPNIKTAAPEAMTNPPFNEPKAKPGPKKEKAVK